MLQNFLDAQGFTEQDETIGQGCSGGCERSGQLSGSLEEPREEQEAPTGWGVIANSNIYPSISQSAKINKSPVSLMLFGVCTVQSYFFFLRFKAGIAQYLLKMTPVLGLDQSNHVRAIM